MFENCWKTPWISTGKKWYSTFQQRFPQILMGKHEKSHMVFHKIDDNASENG